MLGRTAQKDHADIERPGEYPEEPLISTSYSRAQPLQCTNLYAPPARQAREWAASSGIVGDTIVFEEARSAQARMELVQAALLSHDPAVQHVAYYSRPGGRIAPIADISWGRGMIPLGNWFREMMQDSQNLRS